MPLINSTKFGEIIIDGKKYHQVLIVGNAVLERKYEKLEELFDTSHKIGDWEIDSLLKDRPEIIIIGTGQSGMLEVDSDLVRRLENENIEVITATTSSAIKIYNQKIKEGKRVNALIHTTC